LAAELVLTSTYLMPLEPEEPAEWKNPAGRSSEAVTHRQHRAIAPLSGVK
jgi:hypothetical protein